MSEHRRDSESPLSQLQQAVLRHMPAPRDGIPIFTDRSDRMLAVLEAMGIWVSEFDSSGGLTYLSPHVETALGFTPDELVQPDGLQFHPDDLPIVIDSGRQVREHGGASTNQTRMRHKNGDWIWVETTLVGSFSAEDQSYQTIAFSRDITDLKNAQAARSESDARYQVVSEMSRDLITEATVEGFVTYVGPGCREILGYSADEVLALPPFALIHPDDVERVQLQYSDNIDRSLDRDRDPANFTPRLLDYRVRHRDGHWLWFESLGVTYPRTDGETRYLSVSRDVTERRQIERERRELEQAMQRAQKLESLGVLAGGVAHDFNNLLTPILGEAALGIEDLPADSPARIRFQKIQRAAIQAAALTNQMLAYAGQEPLRVERLDLSQVVDDMRELVSSSISRELRVDYELADDLPPVEGEAAQLGQVVLNLVINGAEAMADRLGTITVRTGQVTIGALPPAVLFGDTAVPGRHVFVEVSDTGHGMDPETRDRIFEPFFTTKFTGRGLGLAAVAGVVRSHRGAIEVDSRTNRGTRFRVLLPVASEALPRTPTPDNEVALRWRTSGTVLVIDDDDGVRDLAEDILRRTGLNVLSAADSETGLKLFGLHAGSIDLVLLDCTMPSARCEDTLRALRSLRPDAKIVLISGYTMERATADLAGPPVDGFLRKPFDPESLTRCVRDVLAPRD